MLEIVSTPLYGRVTRRIMASGEPWAYERFHAKDAIGLLLSEPSSTYI